MTDASFSPETLIHRLLFVQRFDRVLNTDASPEACADTLKQLAYTESKASRTVDIYPANNETIHFEIRHATRQRRRSSYTLVKAEGTLRTDPETSRTRVSGNLAVDPVNLGSFAFILVILAIALLDPSFRFTVLLIVGVSVYQAYKIRTVYLDLRAKLFEVLERS